MAVKITLELTDSQYDMLQDCLRTAEVKFRFEASCQVTSDNVQYANRIKFLAEMVEKSKEIKQ